MNIYEIAIVLVLSVIAGCLISISLMLSDIKFDTYVLKNEVSITNAFLRSKTYLFKVEEDIVRISKEEIEDALGYKINIVEKDDVS